MTKPTSLVSEELSYRHHYRPDIDGLRALAVLSVVIYHTFPSWVPGGFIGVDVFFAISGFLISSIIFQSLQEGSFSFVEFYIRRVRRIFPALLLVLVASIVIGWFVLSPEEYKNLGKKIAASACFIQNLALWKDAGYFDIAAELKPLLHLWSLAVEEQYYLLFPLLLWSAWRFGINMLVVVSVVALASYGLNISGMHHDAAKTFFTLQTRAWELLAGSVLAYSSQFSYPMRGLVESPPPRSKKHVNSLNHLLSAIGLFLIALPLFYFDHTMPYPSSRATLPVLGALLLICAGKRAWVNRKLLSTRPMIWIGLISYPLYLWHWPLLYFSRVMRSGVLSEWWRIGIVALSFLLAALTYWFLERPIRYGGKQKSKALGLTLIMVIVGILGYVTYMAGGFPLRIEKENRQISAMFDDRAMPWKKENWDERCKTAFPANSGKYCKLARDTQPTILLMGDSHSAAIHFGLEHEMKNSRENLLLLGQGGCPLFFDAVSYDSDIGANIVPCRDTMKLALNYAETHVNISTVILASTGGIYVSPKGNGSADEKMRAAMRHTLDRLTAKNKKIIFVFDAPKLIFDPRSCVDLHPLKTSNKEVRMPCAIPRKGYDDASHSYRKLTADVLKDYPQVKVFDAAAQLCDKDWCWAMKDKQMLYYDDNHLSYDGSKLVAKELVKLLRD